MKDERIETTINRIARRAFVIWYFLMLIALNYRLLVLKQHPREFWDFIAIFTIANIYGFIAFASKGVLDHRFKRRWLIICISVLIGMLTVSFIGGRIHSVVDVGALLVGLLPGLGLAIGIAYFLNRRWKRKEGIVDEK